MNNDSETIKDTVTNTLAAYLGAEPEDIAEDDNLVEDLHMRPTDISDFIGQLEDKGMDITNLDMTDAQTVSDLIDQLE